MIKELLYKWFGLEKEQCRTCEVLERELDFVRREKEVLLQKLLLKDEPIRVEEKEENTQPLRTTRARFTPSVIRQQLTEQEDRKALELMQRHQKERIQALEEEVLKKEESKENAS